jgi:hypothetical protein
MRVPPIPAPPANPIDTGAAAQNEDAKARQSEPVEEPDEGFAGAVAETVVNIFTDLLSD